MGRSSHTAPTASVGSEYRETGINEGEIVMGLDMYLSKRTYVRNWDHMAPEEQHTITVVGPEAGHIKPERISYIEEQVAYWRKANAIHQWFVTTCQDGVDDCRLAYVSRASLVELHNLCAQLVSLHETDPLEADRRAADVLPPSKGFFFGSQALDGYYWADLRETADVLDRLLAEPGTGASFWYQSSW